MREPRKEPEEREAPHQPHDERHDPCPPTPAYLRLFGLWILLLFGHERTHFVMWWHWLTRRTPVT